MPVRLAEAKKALEGSPDERAAAVPIQRKVANDDAGAGAGPSRPVNLKGDRASGQGTTTRQSERKRQRSQRLRDYVRDEEEDGEDFDPEMVCQKCLKGLPADTMVLCDYPGCATGWHMECLNPPLDDLPVGHWFCPRHPDSPSKLAAAIVPPSQPRERFPFLPVGQEATGQEATSEEARSEDETVPPKEEDDDRDETEQPSSELGDLEKDTGLEDELGEADDEEETEDGGRSKTLAIWDDERLIEYLRTRRLTTLLQQSGKDYMREMNRVRKRSARYSYENDKLYKARPGKMWVIVPRPDKRLELLREAHGMGHFGFAKTYTFMSERFCWEGMKEEIRTYTRNCKSCKADRNKLLWEIPLQPLPIVPMWTRVHIDCMGPYKKMARGNRYCILAVDSWSKYPEVGGLQDRRSITVRTWFWENWICRYGTPAEVLTDRGENSASLDKLLKEQRIRHLRTAGYHPQTNGQAERLVGALLDSLRKLIINREGDWDLQIHQATYAYRASKQISTGLSPTMCMFGRKLTTAFEWEQPPIDEDKEEEDVIDEAEEEIEMEEEHYHALGHRQEAMERMAEVVEAIW
ncbi:hypothetical protein GPECTOR_44g55 [Gonium pectorale]|uniref:Integrase catalytic domain-containing protein n=1 Tax=Gonium pectorale TaxID=33097 RepID=A0A150G949_GONPE|nr:hypothetical protein GPECTOR_44g55 [Gonium pectorale]|eukprot:KXZ46379.1 hypothetical protein GPECTOR_44g55 [Gonium pectorale]